MDEIDYQLSLILLDLLKTNGLLSDLEASKIENQLQNHYHPVITELTLLNRSSE